MSAQAGSPEQVEVSGSHFEVGLALGKRFAEQIHRLFDNYHFLQQQVLPHHRTPSALSYPGFLCGNAFGFNAEGVCFSIDNVRPRDPRVGVVRHFIARSLLEARSLDDAIERVTVPGRALGFSYTIGSVRERRVVNVEVSQEKWVYYPPHLVVTSVCNPLYLALLEIWVISSGAN